MDRVEAIKKDPKYLKLKNKVRSNQENQIFQKYLREIDYLTKQNAEQPVPRAVPPPVAPAPAAFRNQPKPVAFRNQTPEPKKNYGIIDQQYEEEYNTRLQNYSALGKFVSLDSTTSSHSEHAEDNIVQDNIEEVRDVQVEEVHQEAHQEAEETKKVSEASVDSDSSIDLSPPPVKKTAPKKVPKKTVGRKPKPKSKLSDSD